MKIRFRDIPVGARFFDPVSGEFWVKMDASHASMDSGGESGEDEFAEYEEMETED